MWGRYKGGFKTRPYGDFHLAWHPGHKGLAPNRRKTMNEMTGQEALKKLRQERKEFIDQAKNLIKEQSSIFKNIKEELKGDGKTVPEIASATDISSSQILWVVMALKKYGQVIEGLKDGDYFKYQLTNP
jgi:hypothetical protein